MANNNFGEITQITLNVLLILSGFYALLFFVGYLFFWFYFDELGINISFLDYQYYDYVIWGVFVNLIIIVYIMPLVFYWYYLLFQIKKSKDEANKARAEVEKCNMNLSDIEILVKIIENRIKQLEEDEKYLLKSY